MYKQWHLLMKKADSYNLFVIKEEIIVCLFIYYKVFYEKIYIFSGI
jgi:hypothetical protein